MRCAVCRLLDSEIGLLCEDCSDDLASPVHIAPEQLVSPPTPLHNGPALIDRWGRAHRLRSPARLGRQPDSSGVAVLEASISRAHAEVYQAESNWMVRDLGSANGTSLNDVRVVAPTSVRHGDKLTLSQVGFYFVETIDPLAPIDPLTVATDVPGAPAFMRGSTARARAASHSESDTGFGEDSRTSVGLMTVEVRLREPTGGGGGLFEVDGVTVQLSATQYELVSLLVQRMAAEVHQPDDVRGFVRTSELIGNLSWDTRDPSENHVKQLVRRIRRALLKAGVGDLIEARHRFGYRLRAIPRLVS
jgi:hypothetical protein